MFNIGLIELLIIIFFTLILVKPNDFPKIFRQLGLLYRKLNLYVSNFKYELSTLDIEKTKNTKKKNKK